MGKITLSYLLRCGFQYNLTENISQYDKQKYLLLSQKYNNITEYYLKKEYWIYDVGVDGEIPIEIIAFKVRGGWVISKNNKPEFIKNVNELNIKFDLLPKLNLNFVYIIKSDLGYKIGKTKNVDNRLQIFNVKLPFKWFIYKIYATDKMDDLEKFLHQILKEYKINGEWFQLDDLSLKKINKFISVIQVYP